MNERPNWIAVSGTWDFGDEGIAQTDSNAVLTRCWRPIGCANFTANFIMRAESFADGKNAEAKFLFSEADKDERFRIDFMYTQNVCRITAVNLQVMAPLFLTIHRDHTVRVRVREHLLRVFVDEIPILNDIPFNSHSDGRIGFGTHNASAEFKAIRISPLESLHCFVIMPFDERRNLVYEQVIRPALDSHPDIYFKTTRADEKSTAGRVSLEILKDIETSHLIVADITKNNKNVFYEIGYADASRKAIIFLHQRQQGQCPELPFDVRDRRCHFYEFSNSGFQSLRKKLTETASDVVENIRPNRQQPKDSTEPEALA